LLALTAIVTLAACGGSSSSKSSAASTSSSSSGTNNSSSSATASGGDAGDFCKQIVDSRAEQIGEDPNTAKQALAGLRAVNPPDEIKGDWHDYLGALQELSEADQSDQGQLARIAASHAKSLSAVSLYLSKSCLTLG